MGDVTAWCICKLWYFQRKSVIRPNNKVRFFLQHYEEEEIKSSDVPDKDQWGTLISSIWPKATSSVCFGAFTAQFTVFIEETWHWFTQSEKMHTGLNMWGYGQFPVQFMKHNSRISTFPSSEGITWRGRRRLYLSAVQMRLLSHA